MDSTTDNTKQDKCFNTIWSLYDSLNGNKSGEQPHHIFRQIIKTKDCDKWFVTVNILSRNK